MQSSRHYFATGADDVQGSLLSTFALPLSMEDDPEAGSAPTSAVDSSSLNGIESLMGGGQYGSAFPGAYNYPDPLQNSLVSGQFHDYEKDKRSDQMKLTFIMDSGVSGSRAAFMGAADVTVPISPADIPVPKTENFLASLFPPQSMSTGLPHPLSAHLPSSLPSLSMEMYVPLSAPLTVPRVLSNSTVTEPASLVPNRSNKRMQSCSACSLDFSMKSKALYHMYMQHPQAAPSKVYPCSSCENAFARKSDMVTCLQIALPYSSCTASLVLTAFCFSCLPLGNVIVIMYICMTDKAL